jgi:hypothetical protein
LLTPTRITVRSLLTIAIVALLWWNWVPHVATAGGRLIPGAIRGAGEAAAAAGPRTFPVDGRIGIELDALAPGSAAIFVDAMKQALPWTAAGRLHLDAAGNVTSLARGQIAQTVVCAGGSCPAGDYVLLFDGRGTLAASGATLITNSPGRMVVRLAPGVAGVRLSLTATDPADYVRNVRLIAPGHENSYGVAPFFPSYVAALQHVQVLRFAGWARAAGYISPLDWSTRATTTQFSQISRPNI